jgi:hypothetical protein
MPKGGRLRIIRAGVLGAWSPSLLWGKLTTPFGFLGAIAVQSTGHQFRMLLAKTVPFVSCGCLYREVAGKQVRTRGHAGLRTRTYKHV